MNEIFEVSTDLKIISDKLDEIRRLSKGLNPDYRHSPYDNDWRLICLLLDDKIQELENEWKR